jgi:SNF2 family DNA or RNA helicase
MVQILNPEPYPLKTKPFQHQADVVERTWADEYHALFCEMGTGKTKIVIDTAGMLYWNGRITAILALVPKSLTGTWIRELRTHLDDRIMDQAEVVLWRTGKKAAMKAAFDLPTSKKPLRILIANCEALSTSDDLMTAIFNLLRTNRTLVAADESTWLKKHDASRTKAALRVGERAAYRRIMTGTPVTKSPSDLWSQTEFLKRGVMGHRSFFSFRGEFVEMKDKFIGGRRVQKEGSPKNLEKLKWKLDHFTTRLLKKDCLDLPPKVFLKEEVELTDEQRKAYDEMVSSFMVELERADPMEPPALATATQAVTVIMKLHQICCGFLKTDLGEVVRLKENRTALTMERISDHGGSVVVWCAYRPSIDIMASELRARFGQDSVVEFHGGVSDKDRVRAVDRFQSGESPFFLGTVHAAGRGLTLTRSSFSLYHSTTYDFELRAQSVDRIHRIGQEAESCTYLDLFVPNSVEVAIHKTLAANQSLLDVVMSSRVCDLMDIFRGNV